MSEPSSKVPQERKNGTLLTPAEVFVSDEDLEEDDLAAILADLDDL